MRWRRMERMKWVKCEKVEREGRRNEKKKVIDGEH